MQAIALRGHRPRVGDALIVAAVVALAVVALVNGVGQVATNHDAKRAVASFHSYIARTVGHAGFGKPRVKLGSALDTVCASHRVPDYRLCVEMSAGQGRVVRAYEIVRAPGGGSQRVGLTPGRAGSASAAQRST
jgi:hypothetical protein